MKRNDHKIAAIVLSAAVIGAFPINVSAERQENNGSTGNYEDDTRTAGWRTVDGKRFYFDKNGNAVKGARIIRGKKYYFRKDDNGSLFTGLKKIGGRIYYFRAADNGAAVSGWADFKDRRYYFDDDCAAVTGLKEIDGKTYFFDKNGVMQTGLVYIDELVYDFGEDGSLDFSYIEQSKPVDGLSWDMDENAVREHYAGCPSFKSASMLVVKTSDDLKYFVFDNESGKLFAYGSDSPMKDRTEEFSAMLENSGFSLTEETETHGYRTLVFEKDGMYAAVAGNGSSSILLYGSPALSDEYKKGGMDAIIRSAAEQGLPID